MKHLSPMAAPMVAATLLATLFGLTGNAQADPGFSDQVVVTDAVFGSFSGIIPVGASGAAATLSWNSAVGKAFTMALTDPTTGVISDVLTNSGQTDLDILTYYSEGSGHPFIGQTCVAAGVGFCVAETGVLQDVTATVIAAAGITTSFGAPGSMISVLSAIDISEPIGLAILATGIAGLGIIRRRRI